MTLYVLHIIALKWSARRVPHRGAAQQLGSTIRNYQADDQADALADNQADTLTISSELIIRLIMQLLVL